MRADSRLLVDALRATREIYEISKPLFDKKSSFSEKMYAEQKLGKYHTAMPELLNKITHRNDYERNHERDLKQAKRCLSTLYDLTKSILFEVWQEKTIDASERLDHIAEDARVQFNMYMIEFYVRKYPTDSMTDVYHSALPLFGAGRKHHERSDYFNFLIQARQLVA